MKFRPRFDHTRAPATNYLQLEADRRFDETFRKTHCDWQRDHQYNARDLSELGKVRVNSADPQRQNRYHQPTTSNRTHKLARHTLIGTIYRRRAKLKREWERHEQLEALRPPPPSLPPEPSFEELCERDMAEAELDIEKIVYEGAPKSLDEMIEYHQDLYPERYWYQDTERRSPTRGNWHDYLYHFYSLEYFEAA